MDTDNTPTDDYDDAVLLNGNPISRDRFNAPIATERYQPWDRTHALETSPLDPAGQPGLISTIDVGPNGVGAVYEFSEVIGAGQHRHLPHRVPTYFVRMA